MTAATLLKLGIAKRIAVMHTRDMTTTLKVPAKHARDWFDRLGQDKGATVEAETERTITLRLDDEALCDLIADAYYYALEMGPDNTGDIDYRPAAQRLIASIDRQGVKYTRVRFMVDLVSA